MSKLLTTKNIAAIPKSIKPRDYLMKKLSISKESAYRRMRNKVPFTFEEVVTISLDLGFSLDEIAGKNTLTIYQEGDEIGRASCRERVFLSV
jgi:hypothetical protein